MLAVLTIIGAVFFDQVTKFIVDGTMTVGERASFIDGFIRVRYTTNDGAAFGMLDDAPWVFMVLSSVALVLFGYFLFRHSKAHKLFVVSVAMVIGGGIGNMIDRFLYGEVIDFLEFEFVRFAVFNVADCFITVGAVLLVVYVLFIDHKVKKPVFAAGRRDDDDGEEEEGIKRGDSGEEEASGRREAEGEQGDGDGA